MFVTDELLWPPSTCAITGKSTGGPFVDTGNNLPMVDPHIYLSKEGLETVGPLVGLVPRAEVDKLVDRVEGLEGALREAQEQIEHFKALETALEGLGVTEKEVVTNGA